MEKINKSHYFISGTTYIGRALQASLNLLEQRRRNVPTTVILVSDGYVSIQFE